MEYQMVLLPQPIGSQQYWREVYSQEPAVWQPALAALAARHQLPHELWQRLPIGRNIVFASPTSIVKFGPPCWSGEMTREDAALRFVAGKLPIATPTVLASGTLDQWDYLVQARLPGTPLWELWPHMTPDARAKLAYHHGELMAAIHTLPLSHAPPELSVDWAALLGEQHAACALAMQRAGVDAHLVDHVDTYLAATDWSLDAVPLGLLHGDLNHLNLLVSAHEDEWHLSGVIDWGDVKIGPVGHELISPGVHMYHGDPVLLAPWYAGYRLEPRKRTEAYEHLIMARAMLYYADAFPRLLHRIAGAAQCQDWNALAQCFWHMR